MPTRKANAEWKGGLKGGQGSVNTETKVVDSQYSFKTRFEEGKDGTNPEELIGAAHAGCYSMALSAGLEGAGYTPESVNTDASVTEEQVDDGFKITKIHLQANAKVPGIDEQTFQKHAEEAKKNCPVSKALAGTQISLDAKLQ